MILVASSSSLIQGLQADKPKDIQPRQRRETYKHNQRTLSSLPMILLTLNPVFPRRTYCILGKEGVLLVEDIIITIDD